MPSLSWPGCQGENGKLWWEQAKKVVEESPRARGPACSPMALRPFPRDCEGASDSIDCQGFDAHTVVRNCRIGVEIVPRKTLDVDFSSIFCWASLERQQMGGAGRILKYMLDIQSPPASDRVSLLCPLCRR